MSVSIPELVLFDLDGTLVDSAPDLAYSVNAALRQLGLPERRLEDIRCWVGNGLRTLLHRALTNEFDGQAEAALYEQTLTKFTAVYSLHTCRLTTCYPGVREGIRALKERNIMLGCVTNKRGYFAEAILEKTGLKNAMDTFVAGDTLDRKKPHPLPLLHAASALKKTPEKSLMVGDSLNDVKAARAAGFRVICVSYGYNHGEDIRTAGPDAVIDSIADLPMFF